MLSRRNALEMLSFQEESCDTNTVSAEPGSVVRCEYLVLLIA